MEKNNRPYSEPHGLRLAFASDFINFVTIHNRWSGNFGNNKTWIAIPEVPGTLKPTCTSDEANNPTYAVNIKFRVSYDSEENRLEIDSWATAPVIATYISASGKAMIAGSKTYPLRFSFSKVDGFDGYECTIKGTSPYPESFM